MRVRIVRGMFFSSGVEYEFYREEDISIREHFECGECHRVYERLDEAEKCCNARKEAQYNGSLC